MRIVLLVALVVVIGGVFSSLINLPQEVGDDVPQGKLNSLSYAPFREGQSPLEAIFPSVEQIEDDLRLLAEKTHTIRTYASGDGTMKFIPGLAKKYGLNLIQGAWLGYAEGVVENRKEIEALVAAANTYPDVIKRVMVGNEVLLRGEMEPEQLVEFIREVKGRVKQPVSYADVWSMYMKYPQLIKEVDFITIHILPYWEDEPIPVDKAPAHIERIFRQVHKEAEAIAPGKSILIGESGWPSAGKQRGWAVPSVTNEAQFIRGLIKVAQANNFDYNIVEAFNQPWKSELEGVVGANWGLFSVDRQQVFPLTGKVYENSNWLRQFLYGSILLVLTGFFYRSKLQQLSTLQVISFLVFTQVLAGLWFSQTCFSWHTSYTNWQRSQVILMAVVNITLAGFVLHRASALLVGQAVNKIITLGTQWIYAVISVIAIYMTSQLALDGRYISFPFSLINIAVAGLLGLIGIQYLLQRQCSLGLIGFNNLLGAVDKKLFNHKVLGYGLLAIGFLLILGEIRAFLLGRDFNLAYPAIGEKIYWSSIFTLTNIQLLKWLFCLVVLALPFLMSSRQIPKASQL